MMRWYSYLFLAIFTLSLSILAVFLGSDLKVNIFIASTISICLVVGWIYMIFRSDLNGQGTHLHPTPTDNRDRRRLFFTRLDGYGTCKIFQPGTKDIGWKPCKIEVFSTYAALYMGSIWRRDTLTCNAHNLKWMGHIQHIDKNISEICFDLDVDGIWYTAWVRMLRPDTKDFVAAITQILPESLHLKRNRERPNIRHEPIQASLVEAENHNRRNADESLELYLTPLYLVIVMNTFVGQAIPIDSIESFEVGVASEMLPDRRILRLRTTNGTLNYAVPNCPEFEDQLAQITR
jgi:hypothetical protein